VEKKEKPNLGGGKKGDGTKAIVRRWEGGRVSTQFNDFFFSKTDLISPNGKLLSPCDAGNREEKKKRRSKGKEKKRNDAKIRGQRANRRKLLSYQHSSNTFYGTIKRNRTERSD